MKAEELIGQVADVDALNFVADLLPWWRRRGTPEMRARARRAQEIIKNLQREAAEHHQEVA